MNSPLDSAFWDAMIGAIGAVIGAIIGAWTAGKFLLKAQKLEANARRDSERQAQFERVKAVLQAFEVELKAFEAFILGLEQAFTNWEKEPYRKQVPLNLPPVNQNYFTVYDGNGVALGRILDRELRERESSVCIPRPRASLMRLTTTISTFADRNRLAGRFIDRGLVVFEVRNSLAKTESTSHQSMFAGTYDGSILSKKPLCREIKLCCVAR